MRPITRQMPLVYSWHQMERETDPLFWGALIIEPELPYPSPAAGFLRFDSGDYLYEKDTHSH